MVVVVVVVVVAIVNFNNTSGAREWTRQALWYVSCGEAVCIVCLKFITQIYI